MNLSDWAHQVGVSEYATYRWYHAGTLPVPACGAGRLILVGPGWSAGEPGRTVICARVWSAGQRAGLGRQVARLGGWVTAGGMSVGETVTGVGPAVNGRCRRLGGLLAVPAVTRIVVGYRGRLARFGAGYLQAAVAAQDRQVLILGRGEAGGGLVGEMAGVFTSFCARLFGRRGARNRALRAVSCAGSPGSAGA